MPVFTERINAKVQKAANGRRAGEIVDRKANQSIERAKDMLDADVDADPVSRKIEGDPKTIGYFGFEEGELPVEQLKVILDERIKLNQRPRKIGSNQFAVKREYKIKFPSSREIYSESALNLPWISKTWVEGVEQGLSGVERFAFKPGKGRSEFGIQLKGAVKNQITPLQDSDYIARLAKKFSENLKKAS
jgi:hypothetical protein